MTITLVAITTLATSFITYFLVKKLYVKKKWFGRWDIKMTEKIIHIIPDAIYLIDRKHRMMDVLNYDAEKNPIPLEGLIGKLAYEYMNTEDANTMAKLIDEAFRTGELQQRQYLIYSDSGVHRFSGRFQRIHKNWVVCTSHDTTPEYLYEQELINSKKDIEKAQQVNQLILNNANCGLVFIDSNLMVQFENLHTISKEGFDREYKRGEYCYQRVKGRSTPCEDCVAIRSMRSGKTETEKLIIHDDLIFEATTTSVFGSDGESLGAVIKYDNITDKEQTARALQRAKNTAEASDKLKSQFLANISHEIRTPLNAIVGFSDLLIDAEKEEDRRTYIEIIKRNNELLLQLVTDIIDLSRIETDGFEATEDQVDVNSMLSILEASSNIKLNNSSEVKVIFNRPTEKCMIYADENKILQVLFNFTNNAIKFTKKGVIEVGYKLRGDRILFFVSDTGIGIPKEKQADIFNRFVKLNDFANGTGLGLAICKSIIQKLNGEIGVDSTEGEGSTFWFTIPLRTQKHFFLN